MNGRDMKEQTGAGARTVTLKTGQVADIWRVLANAKYGRLADDDRIRLWRTARQLRPLAETFISESRDAAEKMTPTDDFNERLELARQYERCQRDGVPGNAPMTVEAYNAFTAEYRRWQQVVEKAVAELSERVVEVTVEPLDESAFSLLMAASDWTTGQAMLVADLLCP